MEKLKSSWQIGAVLICEKCGRRDDGSGMGKDFAEDCKKVFKSRLRDEGFGKSVRVMTSSCLGPCPKKAHAVAWLPNQGESEVVSFVPKNEMEEIFDWIKEKATKG